MATLVNGQVNGHAFSDPKASVNKRFSDIPIAIEVPVGGEDVEEAVEVNLEELLDDPTELCELLEYENASKNLWMTIALAYAKQHMVDHAIDIVKRGLQALTSAPGKEKIGLLSSLCWLYLWKSREAPRVVPEGELVSEAKTKDSYLQDATGALNEASRVNPSFPPLFLARGILSLLRASLQPPSKPLAPGSIERSERIETLKQALKCFEDASRVSAGRNMMAQLGKARTLFSLARYAESLECYQDVLAKMPDLRDPDPRIGIGCCLWQLTHVEEAREAWERALELNPDSKIANVLIALYHIKSSSNFDVLDPEFVQRYKTAMAVYTQQAYKLDKGYALTCATFGRYFLPGQAWDEVERLARKAIEMTDVNAIASDGWYLLAQKEHYQDSPDWKRVIDFYNRADNARGGGDRGFLPAKFGAAQAQIMNKDMDGAKFQLEKIVQHTHNLEAKILLGTIHAQDIFQSQASGIKEDKVADLKKAIAYLDAARMAWKDPSKGIEPDINVLLTLARLYEIEHPDKSLQCLLQVQQMILDDDSEELNYDDIEDEAVRKQKLMARLPPQLLNNIACFHFQMERFTEATETFQLGLNACMNLQEVDGNTESDQLVTTISYNLARSYEGSGLMDEAKAVYEGLLVRHPDYTDARTRLAYIDLRKNPTSDGPKTMASLYDAEPHDMEVRALYGWYLSKAKRRTTNIAEDQEQRHYKHTLQRFDKHDQYSLTGMGNLHLMLAREMRRDTEPDKEKRRKMYERSVEFFYKALQLDPRNAYAAQGIGIALAEDKKDFSGAVQIFSKLKDIIKESCVLINLAHAYGELKQYSRAIENYEAAIERDRGHDPQVLACLGRVWLLKGKSEKSVAAMKSSLEYSHRALDIAPEQIHFRFNIAFVQIQLAQLIYNLPESKRRLTELETAATGLDEAIESFADIAKAKNPPYPRHDLEQRANMGRNTIRNQLNRAVQAQREYEEANALRLKLAREARDADLRAKEELKRKEEEEEAERKQKLREVREKMLEESREMALKRAEKERARDEAEYTEDSAGEKVKRKRRPRGSGKRKKKAIEEDSGIDGSDVGTGSDGKAAARKKGRTSEDVDGESRAPRKKRKLARKSDGKVSSKFKSSEMVVDSDDDGGETVLVEKATRRSSRRWSGSSQASVEKTDADGDQVMKDADEDGGDEGGEVVRTGRQRKVARLVADDDDNEDDEDDEDERANGPLTTVRESSEGVDGDEDADEETGAKVFAEDAETIVNEDAGIAGGEDNGLI